MHMWMVKIHGQIVCKLKLWHLRFEITLLPQVPTTIPMTPIRKSLPPLAPVPQILDPYHAPFIMQGFVPPLHFQPPLYDGQMFLLGHGPYHGRYPCMYQFHPPPPKCNVQMNPNSEEFIPWYLWE
ncbi:hypothetical protein BDL97_16G013000 [Sphagnum fallax]|nr:hypothetical protein BDL97_16G013000 [Sphagnum fallax]